MHNRWHMKLLSNAMSIEHVTYVKAVAPCKLLYRLSNHIDLLAWTAYFNCLVDSLPCYPIQFLDVRVHLSNFNHQVVISMIAIDEY